MRIEVDILDSSPEAKILGNVADPNAYVLELIRADKGTHAVPRTPEAPDFSGIFARADQSPNRFQNRAEIDEHIAHLRSEW